MLADLMISSAQDTLREIIDLGAYVTFRDAMWTVLLRKECVNVENLEKIHVVEGREHRGRKFIQQFFFHKTVFNPSFY